MQDITLLYLLRISVFRIVYMVIYYIVLKLNYKIKYRHLVVFICISETNRGVSTGSILVYLEEQLHISIPRLLCHAGDDNLA